MTHAAGQSAAPGSRERVISALTAGEASWAVIDGARDRRIWGWIVDGATAQCLYRGPLIQALAASAPYLVRLRPGHDLTERFFALGWPNAWGIVLSSPAPRKQLYRHLRSLLRVRGPDGRPLLFRFYDPRVAGAILPTCTAQELARLLGPISALVLPADDGNMRIFRGDARPQPLSPLRIRPEQMDALDAFVLRRFEDRLTASLEGRHPALPAPRSLVKEGVRRARAYGIDEERDVAAFVDWMATFAADFDAEPYLQAIFSHPRLEGHSKVELARAWLERRT